jgi:two-component system, OmpR family, response regulator
MLRKRLRLRPWIGYIEIVSSRQLLMVDGDPAVQNLMADLLKQDDRTVQGVSGGKEALDLLRTTPYDLVVADPGRNGWDGSKLMRRVRAVRPETKVILTGAQDPGNAIAALRAQAYSYFHKPLAPVPFAEIVRQALDSSSWQKDVQVRSARPEWVTLEVRCKMCAAERSTQLLRELTADMSAGVSEDVTVAFHELLMNAIEHGCKSDPSKRVHVSVLRTSQSLIVHLRDPGKGFALNAIEHAAVCNPENSPTRHVEIRAEQGQRPGGFGILMATKLVDELIYNERGNEVFFLKNFR